MEKKAALALLIDIAKRDVDQVEVSRNRAPWIAKYWPDTSYPDGHKNREPYCAAAMCHWLATWGRELAAAGELKATLGMTLVQFEAWRCKSARAFDWPLWAGKRKLTILTQLGVPRPGDIMVFDMSHIGIVSDLSGYHHVHTIEANTGANGSRDGDGCFAKTRARSLARCFIRLLP